MLADAATHPTEYLQASFEECGTEPDLELSTIFAGSRDSVGPHCGAHLSGASPHDASSPHRSDASSIPVDPTAAAQFERCSPAAGELRADAAFQFSPILATAAQLNAEVGLSASAGLLGIVRGESPGGFSPHADGNSPLSLMLARARGERLYGERAHDRLPSALAHAPPTPPPMPPPFVPPYQPAALSGGGGGQIGAPSARRSPAGFSLFNYGKPRTPTADQAAGYPSSPLLPGGAAAAEPAPAPGAPKAAAAALAAEAAAGGAAFSRAGGPSGYASVTSGYAMFCGPTVVDRGLAQPPPSQPPALAAAAHAAGGGCGGGGGGGCGGGAPSVERSAGARGGCADGGAGGPAASQPPPLLPLPPPPHGYPPQQPPLPAPSPHVWPHAAPPHAAPPRAAQPPPPASSAPRAAAAVSGPGAPVAAAACGAPGRAELNMSPLTRGVYKDFVSSLRARETSGHTLPALCAFVDERLRELPAPLHWRVHLELADLSKREQRFAQARRLYGAATRLQPSAPQPWLEHAKMEEERGHFERCQRILRQGLRHCAHNEALLLKAIKLHERRGDLPAARRLLARLAPVAVERAWRALLEGALLEARTANVRTARRVFKFLLHHAAWCGPVWHEACRFEQRNECDGRALRLAERGLSQLPRYGPLWFVALRLLECVLPPAELLARARALVARGASTISKDLVWKLWLEYARLEDRRGSLRGAREAFAAAVLACPPNLRWKVWLGGARTELAHARADVAAALLERAMAEAPQKVRGSVRLERARLAEVTGRLPAARAELRAARRECPHEWKVFLEAVLLEVRARRPRRALRAARRALRAHAGTGRLWAVLIQLRPSLPPPREGEGGDEADDDDDERRGVGGGVGGHGDGGGGADDEAAAVGSQRLLRVFREALQQVPKSGEVWCEGARICLDPTSAAFNPAAARRFLEFAIEFTPQYGDSFVEYLRLLLLLGAPLVDLRRLAQLCVNAEPNYGSLWFHCRRHLLLGTRQVLLIAQQLLAVELAHHAPLYESAMRSAGFESFTLRLPQLERDALPAELMPPAELLDGSVQPGDFSTGSLALNRMIRSASSLTLEQRRSLIYGGDQLVP